MTNKLRPTLVKDVAICNWVLAWDPKNNMPVVSFFKKIEEAAQMGGLMEQDKILLIRMKIRGAAETYLNTHPELQDEIMYGEMKAKLIERFKEKHPDAYYFAQFQMARQKKGENPEEFADRLRGLNERTIIKAEMPEARHVLYAEAERKLLAQFIAGLSGLPGDQVRIQMPTSMEQAICIAVTATQMEEAKGVRGETASHAFGLMVAQSQNGNNYRGREKGRRV